MGSVNSVHNNSLVPVNRAFHPCVFSPQFQIIQPYQYTSESGTFRGLAMLNRENVILKMYAKQREAAAISDAAEALRHMEAALRAKEAGKPGKAEKLFNQAFAFDPDHPDLLNHYGQFIEETQNNIQKADQMYFLALTSAPDHPGALANRRRTAPIVQKLDRSILRRIDEKSDRLDAISPSNSAKEQVYFWADGAVSLSSTGDWIEGNTMASQTNGITELEHNEINVTLSYGFGGKPLDISEMHCLLMGSDECGTIRRKQVYVGGHTPPAPHEIEVQMEEFTQWLNSDEAAHMHPVRLGALAHYWLVHIHPFTDGNGRTARLLMNIILRTARFPPVFIFKHDKQGREKYNECLKLANKGDARPLVRFIAMRTEQTLDCQLRALSEHKTDLPALEKRASQTVIVDDGGDHIKL